MGCGHSAAAPAPAAAAHDVKSREVDVQPVHKEIPVPKTTAEIPPHDRAPPKPGDVNWKEINEKLPIAKDDEDKKKRADLFNKFDVNKSGYLSLAKVDGGIRDILKLDELFDAKPAIMRAFMAAKEHKAKSGKGHSPDYVERAEFRLLLVFLRRYFELWEMYETMDASRDRRVTQVEFDGCAAKLKEWGLQIEDPAAAYKEMDVGGGGNASFDEFAHWALKQHLDLDDGADE